MRYLVFLFIPICVYLVVVPLREAWGHYYYALHSDPSYLYLINGLNIATLKPSAHVDNPGTTTQVFSALVLKVSSLINGTEDLQKDIILQPDKYIILINRALFLVCLLFLFLFGVFAFEFTGSLWFSLFLQTVPFYSWQLMRIFLKVSPEMMIFISCLLWVATLLRLSAKDDFKEHPLRYTIWFAVLTAFSLATKLTMIPFVLIPLILMPLRPSLNYLMLCFIIFHLFIFPAWTHYDYLIGWIGKLFKHSNLYGTGSPTVIEFPQAFFSFLKLIALEHPFYLIVTVSIILLAKIFSSTSLRTLRHFIDVKILISLITVALVQLMMISKHFNPHYLIPSLMLFTTIIYFCMRVYLRMLTVEPECFEWRKKVWVKSSIFISFLILLLLRHSAKYLTETGPEQWFKSVIFPNTIWIIITAALFTLTSALLKLRPKARRGFLNISIWCVAIIYFIRHADVEGFRNRLIHEAREAETMIGIINERFSDHTLIYGERSSSIFYALKYGANENFSQPEHFKRMRELYNKEAYFWDHSDHFENWTDEISLNDILQQNEKVLLECDKRFTPAEKLNELQLANNAILKEVYSGPTGQLFIISPR